MAKGIILAGGSGTRLYPVTIPVIKQLLPVYDKPMIYYPLAVLMSANVRDILIISTREDLPRYQQLFSNGSHLGLRITYAIQEAPNGIAEALIIGESFIDNDNCWLILGDNIFFGHDLPGILEKTNEQKTGATVFGYYVSDPERYGVVDFDERFKACSIEEKPAEPKSNYAVTGLYYYDKEAPEIAKKLQPSNRGELEITALNNEYLKNGRLEVKIMGRGYAWLDTGTHESLLDASNFVRIIEERQGLKIACIEEIAYRKGYIDLVQFKKISEPLKKSHYGKYLKKIVEDSHAL